MAEKQERRLVATIRSISAAHPYMTLFVVALTLRVMVALLANKFFGGAVLDDETYDFMATDMATGQAKHWDPFTYSLYWRTAAFLGPVTLIYKVFGPVKLAGQIFVALLGATAVVLAVRLLREFVSKSWAFLGGVVLAFLPSQVFWSAMLMKDAAVWVALLGVALSVAIAGRASGRTLVGCGFGLIASLVMLSFLREHTLVVAAWAAMVGSVAGVAHHRVQRITGAIAISVAVPWFVASIGPAGVTLVTDQGSLAERRFYNAVDANTAVVDVGRPPPGVVPPAVRDEVDDLTTKANDLEAQAATIEAQAAEIEDDAVDERRDERREARAERLAARAERLRARAAAQRKAAEELIPEAPPADASLDADLAHLPRGLSVMLLEPWPVPFTGSTSLRLARLESLVWYPLLVLASVGLWHARKVLRVLLMPIVAGAGIVVMYALTEGNIGTAHRHRGEFIWVVVILAVLGTRELWRYKESSIPTRA